MSGQQYAGMHGPLKTFKLSCGCTVQFRSAPPSVGSVILCYHCRASVKVTKLVRSDSSAKRNVA